MKKSTFVVASRRTLNPKEEEEAVDEDVGDGVGDAGVDELVVVVSYYRRVGGDEGGVRRRRWRRRRGHGGTETFTDLVDVVVQEIRALDANSFDAVVRSVPNNSASQAQREFTQSSKRRR